MKEVRIKKLENMQAAYFHAFSESPEEDAWRKLKDWAEPRGLLKDAKKHRVFGRNNPPPSPGEKAYGYEFFIVVDPDAESMDDAEVKEIPGSPCAVLACKGVQNLQEAWGRLYKWVRDSNHEVTAHGLEEHLDPLETSLEKLPFDLWLPIEEAEPALAKA